jgi:hypothetical protein
MTENTITATMREGMRVELIQGELRENSDPPVREGFQSWIAGNIPVGATGTVKSYQVGELSDFRILGVEWDQDDLKITPEQYHADREHQWIFAVGQLGEKLPDYLKEIS